MSAALITQYEEHLALVRNLSDNSIKGYVTDLESFLKHMEKLGIVEFNQLEIEHIRSWLANLQTTGVARATLTRRIVSIRAFTNWAAANGWLTSDLGANLAVPKPHKVLPEVLNVDEAATVLKALEVKSVEAPTAVNIRDLALVEVLYGSGIRVSELCGLNLSDVDRTRNTLNVIGKGDKQRVVP
ncbi:MAG: recombinase XerC, partial [Actinobacteria bacterium]|nr:recombinase XerC [Actinomycetota bacterium]